MKCLEYDADMVAAETSAGIFIERPDVLSDDGDAARGGALKAGDDHHKAGLAGTRRPHQPDQFAGRDAQIHAAQHVDGSGRPRQGKRHRIEIDDRCWELACRGE